MRNVKPAKHKVHLFSGDHRNFEDLAKESKDNILHLPAHTSMTHDWGTAKSFALAKRDSSKRYNIMHIAIAPRDKLIHVAHISHSDHEYESILPAGTNIKYHGTTHLEIEHATPYENNGIMHSIIKLHHFTVHSQE